jgi:outer membrane receptor protein involved in Fe transport
MVGGRPLTDIEEIIVTGTNIRGIENNTAPVTVLSKQYIDSTGYSTVAQLLESVTQNFALANESGINTPGVSGNNREQGSSINLRGLGEGTTLVLLNGRRLAPGFRSAAVDISALPLSAIERVEILPDGASALYGSDAVGGVVNFILREDFEGVETRLRAGTADGVDEYRASQAIGNSWDTGNFLASLEYFDRDLLEASDRDFVPNTSLVGSLAPEVENYSAIVTVQQQLGGAVSVFADLLYANRDSFNQAGRVTFNEATDTENVQAVGTLGLNWNFAGDWVAELSGSYARNDIDQVLFNTTAAGAPNNLGRDMVFDVEAGELKLDGSLFTLPGGTVRAALGAAYRNESYRDLSKSLQNGAVTQTFDVDQSIRSAFGEVYVPLVGKDNAVSGVQRLELSLAGRYDDYSTSGSSFDPTAGLMWEPVSGLRLRGRYSTSYKAPNLVEYTFASNFGQGGTFTIPGTTTPLQALFLSGIDVDSLAPQESESSSFGLEIAPESMPGFDVAFNYYKIRYSNSVATPANGVGATILTNQAFYQDLITFDPSPDQVNQAVALARLGRGFFPAPTFNLNNVDVIVDARRRNLSVVRAEGLDLSTTYTFKVASSSVTLGASGTYVMNQEQQITDASPAIDVVDTIYNPTRLRARGFVGWQMQGWAANLFVNHTDSYIDNRLLTRPTVDSYTTLDTRLAYDFSQRFRSGALSGVTVAFNVQNVLDEDPPPVTVITTGVGTADPGFDSVNADPLGRFISLEITKVW